MAIKNIHIHTDTKVDIGGRDIQEVLDEIELHCMQASLYLKYLEDTLSEISQENKEDISSIDRHINQILNLIRE